MFALVDCNNFFVSCERVFNPALKNRPVVILSNNDGCIISRSNEAKAIGIPMGIPLFKVRPLIHRHQVVTLSSNFSLYGDMSRRVMTTLRHLCPSLEIYSVDEAFLDVTSITQLEAFASTLHDTLAQWLGLPVTVGIAPTKTLTKVANKVAKDQGLATMVLTGPAPIENALSNFPVQEVWGIGRQMAKGLRQQGIFTALDLRKVDPRWMRQKYTVIGERLVRELNGMPCLGLEVESNHKKSIQVTRSFGRPITTLEDMEQAVATYVTRLSQKLRQSGVYTYGLSLYMRTSPHKPHFVYHSLEKMLNEPTQETQTLIKLGLTLARVLFKPGIAYQKAGVLACPLTHRSASRQARLFEDPFAKEKRKGRGKERKTLDGAIDHLNRKYGANTLRYAVCGLNPTWIVKSDHKSPAYTTNWREILVVGG